MHPSLAWLVHARRHRNFIINDMSQRSFASVEYAMKKKCTRREKFLADMERVVPWPRLVGVIEPLYPTSGRVGRQPGAAARPELLRSGRRGPWRQPAAVRQRRVRRFPGVRHPGARLPAPALRRLRPRQARGVQLQATRILPLVRGATHGAERRAPGRSRHRRACRCASGCCHCRSRCAWLAGRTTVAGDAGAAGRAPCHHPLPARSGGAQGRAGRQRRGHADPAIWVSGQSECAATIPSLCK